ncbi:MAG: hypothetical protein JW953_17065 [Anaerolineae bacterium]|nr:hypothetical protein [Anaerolineae bacterium]
MILSTNIVTRAFGLIISASLLLGSQPIARAQTDTVQAFNLHRGEMANYGATPWYTENISVGTSQLRFALDSGSNFIWATSDLCTTEACNTHKKVNTAQLDFTWVNTTTVKRSFGPWGSMNTWTGMVPFETPFTSIDIPFFASVEYSGEKFQYLAWEGGVGFPSSSDAVADGSGFYFHSLYESGAIVEPTFSVVTYPETGEGTFFLGGDDPAQYDESSEIELQPNRTGEGKYLWGTDLYAAQLGDTLLPSLTNSRFYLDTGSSVFKGDSVYLIPVMTHLYDIRDAANERIFEKIYDTEGRWIGLVYANGGDPTKHAAILPDFTLTMGQSCEMQAGQAAKISLNAQQYSYYVEEGDQQGQWVVAFTPLDGVGGLLVGSTFMDLMYTTFNYVAEENGGLTQGNMYLYQKATGTGPSALSCIPLPETAMANSPVTGTWYNSYCSQMNLAVNSSGEIKGVYTSHTGSTGSSNIVGWVGAAKSNAKVNTSINATPVNPNGIPVALGIQWRLINQPISDMDDSWHWVSTFSGQYHPAQIISVKGQDNYLLPETLEILNGLLATAKVLGLADTAPKMWPQTLEFHRTPPSYCQPVSPPDPVPFSATAEDFVTGLWSNPDGDVLHLKADMETGRITGSYTAKATGDEYQVTGLIDAIKGDLPNIVEQGVALTMSSKTKFVLSMAGGVLFSDSATMIMWEDKLTSTTWTDRFVASTFDKVIWTRQSD